MLANGRGLGSSAAAACTALARVVFAMPAITKSADRARSAGTWALAAQLRPGCRPTMPTLRGCDVIGSFSPNDGCGSMPSAPVVDIIISVQFLRHAEADA